MAAEPGATPSDLRPPLLGHRYVVQRRIGRGGTASVYTVYDLRLRTWRAAKVMHAECAEDEELRERFVLEAAAMANLDHPHVVRVSDVVHNVDIPYIVMEWLEGGSVATWVKDHGQMPVDLALEVMSDIASALAFVHAKGIVHRDVNPRNMLIDRSGSCKLTDFGIARISAESVTLGDDIDRHLTEAGTVMGTEAYMAPEQRRDSAQVDHRTDLYAAGATLYTLITGRLPPDLAVIGGGDPRLRDLPPGVSKLLLRACAYDAQERFEDASTLRREFQALRKRFPDRPVRDRLVPAGPPLSTMPPRELELTDVTSLGELLESGALEGTYDGTGMESQTSSRDFLSADVRRGTVWALVMGAMFGTTVFVAVAAAALAISAHAISSAAFATHQAEETYHRRLAYHREALGQLTGSLDEAYGAFDRAASNERAAAAERLYGIAAAPHPAAVDEALGDVATARDDYLRAYARWVSAADGPVGRLAVGIGFADGPP